MKRLPLFFFTAVCALMVIASFSSLQAQSFRASRTPLEVTISGLPNVTKVTRLESTEFTEKYEIFVRQQINPDNIRFGFFEQRVFLMHVGADRPTVLVTEGYGADYAARPRYREELSRLFNANLIVVEHRFFSQSIPQPRRWQFLTGEIAMQDIHNVRELFRPIYQGKWIATGISKGGQTALMYRTLFPGDVDITVSYVGPLCRGVEDGRHEPFLKNKVGTPADRERILDFQKELLIRKDSLMVPFTKFCEEGNMKFTFPLRDVFDYCVLEYPFAFWQWGIPVDRIPDVNAADSVLMTHFLQVSSPDYFMRYTPNIAFFVQAARQLGYYGYDMSPFKFKVTRTKFIEDGSLKKKLEANKIARREAKEKKKLAKDLGPEGVAGAVASTAAVAKITNDATADAKSITDTAAVTGKWVTRKYPAMEIKSPKGYLKRIFLPDFFKPTFNNKLYKRQLEFIKTTDAHLVFIYGEWDPWSAAAVPNPHRENVIYCVQPKGSHASRIGSLPEDMRANLMKQLETWLAE